MIKKICFCIFLFFCFFLNILIDFNIHNYIEILNKCFETNIILTNQLYVFICSINALISVLIIISILLVFFKNKNENKGINIKAEDGTYGTANWMSFEEMKNILGINNIPGIILGKHNDNIIKLPLDSYFNKNMCVFGSSGSMKTIRFFINKFT